MAAPCTVVVTLHGIGFQHPPDGDTAGYADQLHSNLHAELKELLSDDPNRQRQEPGQAGAIYVQSNYAEDVLPANYIIPPDPGLARLGTWREGVPHEIDYTDQQRLVASDEAISHVALVYTNLEGVGLHGAALAEMTAKAGFSLAHYTSVAGAIRLLLHDTAAIVKGDFAATQGHKEASPSLRPRRDIDSSAHHSFFHLLHPQSKQPDPPTGPLTVWDTIQDDLATYVCRNDIREDVRIFVHEALLRLCSRDDVAGVILNAHSQGTVVAYDVLRELPLFAAQKIRAFVTAGSPLRKYVQCFTWGDEVGCIWQIKGPDNGWFAGRQGAMTNGNGWINFWDDTDPVADPLSPGREWQPGMPLPEAPDPLQGLFRAHDPNSGAPIPFLITDCQVDNWQESSGGGLQSHNYWDNQKRFVEPLAAIARTVSGT